ncbi:glycoside hydrolase family 76 protein, partial [Pseudocercospora fijiensis CIRAD86]
EKTQDAIATLQSTFFNGTYYPGTLQWINALVKGTFTTGLATYNGNIPGAQTTAAEIQNNIQKYYSQIEAYYGGEDTIQIFDAAYDDAQWVVLEWLEVIRFLAQYNADTQSNLGQSNIANYAHRAHIFYNIVQDKFDTSQCDGGLTWNPTLATYKNAITNELFVSSSIAMYFFFPGDSNTDPYPHPDYQAQTNNTLPPLPYLAPHDPLLLQHAEETWTWMKTHNFTNSQGLIVDGFHVSDGQSSCDERNEMVYTYNQGVMLSGLRYLWEATGDTTYLNDGYNLIDTVIRATGWSAHGYAQAGEWAGLGRNGILEDYCDAPANCSQDNLIFKGAYFESMDIFCNALPTATPMVAGISKLASSDLAEQHYTKCSSYSPWVQHNAWAALSTRNNSGVFGEWW